MLSQDEKIDIYRVAIALADVARATILPLFRTGNLLTKNKLSVGYDPVTVADNWGKSMTQPRAPAA